MNQQQRNTRTQIQGIVSVVFDLYEKFGGIIPQPEDFTYAIKVWMEEGRVITSFPGIDNKRLPVPEINVCGNEFDSFETGDYVLATKWSDGDPQDHWCIGFFSHMLGGRYIVVDGEGKPFRANGFRECRKISEARGNWMLENALMIEQSDLSIWEYWFTFDYEKEIK